MRYKNKEKRYFSGRRPLPENEPRITQELFGFSLM